MCLQTAVRRVILKVTVPSVLEEARLHHHKQNDRFKQLELNERRMVNITKFVTGCSDDVFEQEHLLVFVCVYLCVCVRVCVRVSGWGGFKRYDRYLIAGDKVGNSKAYRQTAYASQGRA